VQYTIEDLKEAKALLDRMQEREANSSASNPDKYRSRIRSALSRFEIINESLKSQGEIERTDTEKLEIELDSLFPNARSKEVVDYAGRKYMRRFVPAQKSRSRKTVVKWNKYWELVG